MALFHVLATHSDARCPGSQPEMIPGVVRAFEEMDAVARRHGVSVLGHYTALRGHFDVQMVEAGSLAEATSFAEEVGDAAYGDVTLHVVPVIERDELLRQTAEAAARA